jgi:hypothetical protein
MTILNTKAQTLINLINKFIVMPCAPETFVYVEAAFDALFTLYWSIYTPDLRELVTKGTGRSGLCWAKTGLKEAGAIEDVNKGLARSTLWHILETADLSTWYAFVAMSGVDGLINAFSELVRVSGCTEPPGNYAYGNHCIGGWPIGPDIIGKWVPGPSWWGPDPSDPHQRVHAVLAYPGEYWTITGSAQILTLGYPPLPCAVVLQPFIGDEPQGEPSIPAVGVLEGSHTSGWWAGQNTRDQPYTVNMQMKFIFVPPGFSRAVPNPIGSGYLASGAKPPWHHGTQWTGGA